MKEILMKKGQRNKGKRERGITLIALVITILFSYDEKIKCSNSKGFLPNIYYRTNKIFTYLEDEL